MESSSQPIVDLEEVPTTSKVPMKISPTSSIQSIQGQRRDLNHHPSLPVSTLLLLRESRLPPKLFRIISFPMSIEGPSLVKTRDYV